MRICARKPPVPPKVPGSPADLLAGKVVMYLRSSEGTGYSLSMFLCTLGYAPPLLEGNEALFGATDLLLSTWQKLRRGAGPEDLFDLASYSRAIRSLQKVLNDPREQKSSSTLAAAIYLQMSEASDIDNFFVRPEWQNALNGLFSQYKGKIPVIMEMSKLVIYATMVAEATKRFSKVRNISPELQDLQELEEVAAVIDDADSKFRDLDMSTVPPLLQSNVIFEEEDPASPVGTSYSFPSPIMSLYFANIGAFRIVLNRLRQDLNAIRGIDDPSLEAECMEWSARIWKTCRYSQSLKPLCSVSFNSPICVSYITAPPAIRSYLLATLKDSDDYRKHSATRWTEPVIYAQYNVLLGRLSMADIRSSQGWKAALDQ
ncbi:hypothetical protein Hte_000493 [Hypoxylon texense]